jgi:uncharacterized protein (DUF1800 family)
LSPEWARRASRRAGETSRIAAVATYRGPFGAAQAERLLWRAGFGPRPGEAKRLAKLGLDGAVLSLTRPGRERFVGPPPKDSKGRALAPEDAWGHDHLWWLDRMVRTSRPLLERMTLVWHDWFATSLDGVGSQKLMLRQNNLFRRHAFGDFRQLLLDVTADPAMLLWLNGAENSRRSPNENYARELMELFTLGAKRGYSENDVREQARALTGFRYDWKRGVGATDFRYDRGRHDVGVKSIFGKHGTFDWKDACHLCLRNKAHPSFFVSKLWSYFVPTPADRATQRLLERRYADTWQVRPILEAILRHPALYEGPRMTKPPVVVTAGMLRALRKGVDTDSWVWLNGSGGQRLFEPPNVAGWDDARWLDTATYLARWRSAGQALNAYRLDANKPPKGLPATAEGQVALALRFWAEPHLTEKTHALLLSFARRSLQDAAKQSWKQKSYPALLQNALRHLVVMSPDYQTA